MSDGPTPEEVHDAIDRAVVDLLDAAGVSGPPVDAIRLATQHLGLVIPSPRAQAQRGGSTRASSAEQQQWAAAQRIGGHEKAALLERLDVDPQQGRALGGGSLGNLFAERLLVPTAWLVDEARSSGFDLLALKERFATASHEVIAWRLLDLPEPCIVTIVDNDHVSWRRSNGHRVNREMSAAERRCQQRVHRYGRPDEVNEEGWRVWCWPIHEVDWKREIVRSVLEET